MPPEDTPADLAVVVARLDDLRADFRQLRRDIAEQNGRNVSRAEWELRNQHVDSKFSAQGREIGDLRIEIRAKRLPWTTVATALVAIGGLVLGLVQAIG